MSPPNKKMRISPALDISIVDSVFKNDLICLRTGYLATIDDFRHIREFIASSATMRGMCCYIFANNSELNFTTDRLNVDSKFLFGNQPSKDMGFLTTLAVNNFRKTFIDSVSELLKYRIIGFEKVRHPKSIVYKLELTYMLSTDFDVLVEYSDVGEFKFFARSNKIFLLLYLKR
jgi:hypothetical protein